MTEHSAYRIVAVVLACMACLMAGVAVGVRAAPPAADGLVPVAQLDYTNTYPDLNIVCSWRGSRADFDVDGGDIRVGDRVVRDCRAVAP